MKTSLFFTFLLFLSLPLHPCDGLVYGKFDSICQQVMDAAASGDTKSMAAFIKQKQYNITDDSGRTPLMIAAIFGQDNIVKLLLKDSKDIDSKDQKGFTALMYAGGFIHIFKSYDLWNIMRESQAIFTLKKRVNIFKILIDLTSDLNIKTGAGETIFTISKNEPTNDFIEILQVQKKNSKLLTKNNRPEAYKIFTDGIIFHVADPSKAEIVDMGLKKPQEITRYCVHNGVFIIKEKMIEKKSFSYKEHYVVKFTNKSGVASTDFIHVVKDRFDDYAAFFILFKDATLMYYVFKQGSGNVVINTVSLKKFKVPDDTEIKVHDVDLKRMKYKITISRSSFIKEKTYRADLILGDEVK